MQHRAEGCLNDALLGLLVMVTSLSTTSQYLKCWCWNYFGHSSVLCLYLSIPLSKFSILINFFFIMSYFGKIIRSQLLIFNFHKVDISNSTAVFKNTFSLLIWFNMFHGYIHNSDLVFMLSLDLNTVYDVDFSTSDCLFYLILSYRLFQRHVNATLSFRLFSLYHQQQGSSAFLRVYSNIMWPKTLWNLQNLGVNRFHSFTHFLIGNGEEKLGRAGREVF